MSSIGLQVQEIGHLGTTKKRVDIQGDDELSDLALEINRMLDFIEQTRRKLQENEEQIREVVENIPDYVIIYSQKREILYINPATIQALGYSLDYMEGKPIFMAIAEEYRDLVKTCMENRQKGEDIPPYEIEVKTREGTRRTVLVKGRNIRYQSDPATLLLLVDITERKEHDREREIHTQELERISLSLKQANRQVNLLSSVTRHDILNQVNLGYLLLDSLGMKYQDPELQKKLDDIILVIQTIQHQIEFTRVYEGLGMQEPEWQNLQHIISLLHIPSSISSEIHLKGITLYADKMLEKVFFNLVDNSIRHGQGVTEIRIYFRQTSENLIISYEDNGIGIPEGEKDQIFERGYGKNTGFGLFLVKEILSLTDISIHETGIFGIGARFEITVPQEMFRIIDE
jgi:PAS domain S-box-containing protein